jgi:hypothetical protein
MCGGGKAFQGPFPDGIPDVFETSGKKTHFVPVAHGQLLSNTKTNNDLAIGMPGRLGWNGL